LEPDNSGDPGKEGVIIPSPDIDSRLEGRASLADKDRPGFYLLPAVLFNAQSFRMAVPSVPSAASRFFMSHF